MIRALSMFASALALAFAIASAQTPSPAPAGKSGSVYGELARVPRKVAGRRNPLMADPDAVAAGAKLFELHCAECHGDMAEGGKKAPSLLADEVRQATPGTLFWLLTNGVVRRGMPVWSKLPEPQRWQLVSYIKSLTPSAKPKTEGGTPPQAAVRRTGSGILTGSAFATFLLAPASNCSVTIDSSAPSREALIDRRARHDTRWSVCGQSDVYKRGELKWQATESSK